MAFEPVYAFALEPAGWQALTGEAAYDYVTAQDHRLAEAALALKARPEEVADRVKTLMDERRRAGCQIVGLWATGLGRHRAGGNPLKERLGDGGAGKQRQRDS